MSKIIKPLLNADGTQVKRKLQKGEWYFRLLDDAYVECSTPEIFSSIYPIYYAEDWKLKENEMYYYYNFHFCEVISTYHTNNLFDKTNIATDNCFRTREEAEQADIQTILDNLKTYYKKKNKEAGK